ncbi:MAG: GNAT family protein [Anaerovoracaceae bacterium]|nr:GNAT family N-acetyltransferase [Bacillota bacterium]MEE0517314.1 GNAT family protein [Anaerovoracaceae bacterium]
MLTTKRLILEKFKAEELSELMKIEHDPENCKFTWTNTLEEHLEELKDPDVLTLAVKKRENGNIIGDVIINLDFESEWFEIKRIAFSEKGSGYGRETMNALIKYAFEELNMNKVWLEAYTDNKVGRNLYESLGFHIDGILRQHHKTERGILDQMQFSMLAGEYRQLKEKGVFTR